MPTDTDPVNDVFEKNTALVKERFTQIASSRDLPEQPEDLASEIAKLKKGERASEALLARMRAAVDERPPVMHLKEVLKGRHEAIVLTELLRFFGASAVAPMVGAQPFDKDMSSQDLFEGVVATYTVLGIKSPLTSMDMAMFQEVTAHIFRVLDFLDVIPTTAPTAE